MQNNIQTKLCVYFLTDGTRKRSYIGYSVNGYHRYRKHCLKLKSSAKYTKTFKECHMWIMITGFQSKHKALSAEWFCKRKKLKIHSKMLKLPPTCPHKRISTFLAPLLHDKFKDLRKNLTVYVRDPKKSWSTNISRHYKVEVKDLQPPFCPDHLM